MALSLTLKLDERRAARVFVTLSLEPLGDPIPIGGVEVELASRIGERLSSRMILPISGTLAGPLATRVELRAFDHIPRGAAVIGKVWWDQEELEAICPTDPCTELESFVRGDRSVLPLDKDYELQDLRKGEQCGLIQVFPWMNGFQPCQRGDPAKAAILDEAASVDDFVEDVTGRLGLDASCAKWIKDILEEDEE